MIDWHTDMTQEDMDRNMKEWRLQRKRDAAYLRAKARYLLIRADEIDPAQKEHEELPKHVKLTNKGDVQ